MADVSDYLSLYPKSFLRAFGYLPEAAIDVVFRDHGGLLKRLAESPPPERSRPNPEKARRAQRGSAGSQVPSRTKCKYGHPYSKYQRIDTNGQLRCRLCLRVANRRYEARKRTGR